MDNNAAASEMQKNHCHCITPQFIKNMSHMRPTKHLCSLISAFDIGSLDSGVTRCYIKNLKTVAEQEALNMHNIEPAHEIMVLIA